MQNFKTYIEEGKNDASIFHAIFMAGGPGSGKSYVNKQLGLQALNYVDINSDTALEHAMKKSLLDLNMPEGEAYAKDIVRGLAKKTTAKKKGHAVEGRLGIVIDGTGAKFNKMKKQVEDLQKLGYEVAMVFVDTDKETALHRNNQRERSLNPKLVTKMWDDVQKNKNNYKKLFGKNFYLVNNSEGANLSEVSRVFAKLMTWSKKLPNNPQVKAWMEAN